jgi:hypothetical protein
MFHTAFTSLTAKKTDCQNDDRHKAQSILLSSTREVSMQKLAITAMAFFFACGIGSVATQAGETKAKMEEMKGEVKSMNEDTKAENKALREEAKGKDAKATMERGKGKMKSSGEKAKGKGKKLKAKTE